MVNTDGGVIRLPIHSGGFIDLPTICGYRGAVCVQRTDDVDAIPAECVVLTGALLLHATRTSSTYSCGGLLLHLVDKPCAEPNVSVRFSVWPTAT